MKIDKLIIHCSASNVKKHGERMKHYLHKWHVEENGWSDIGYQYAIDINGAVIPCRPESKVGAHCLGQNGSSLGICLHGKNPEDFKECQFEALRRLCKKLCKKYDLNYEYDIFPHNKFANKACPNFDLKQTL